MARILILTPQLPIPPQALTGMSQGTTIRNFNLIAGLAKRHDVDLLTFRAPAALQSGDAGEVRDTSAVEPEAAALDLLRPYCGDHRRGTSACANPGASGARYRAESPA